MALTKAQREERREKAAETLRMYWRRGKPAERRVTLGLQKGRRRPRVTGEVTYVATSGAFCLIDDGTGNPTHLHVPVDRIRSVDPAEETP